MTRVLFTGGGGAGNEALWRLLGGRYELHFGDADAQAIDPQIPAGRRHALPWANDPAFATSMAALCARLSIDILVPGVDEELAPLAAARESFGATSVLIPGEAYVRTMTDKWSMACALAEKGLPVPATRLLSDGPGGIPFPCIAKPRQGRGSRDVRVLASAEDAEALRAAAGAAADRTLLQQRVEGIEYTVQMMADASARLHAVVPVRVGIKRGITLRSVTQDHPGVDAACRAIHEALPAAGCYNIQLMLTPSGEVLPFEINPRVSTTLCLCVAAGVDPIAIWQAQAPAHRA
ncbi:MAG: ATP-grasp domain-containing protein, partial [Burkholderiaceae bacterium]